MAIGARSGDGSRVARHAVPAAVSGLSGPVRNYGGIRPAMHPGRAALGF